MYTVHANPAKPSRSAPDSAQGLWTYCDVDDRTGRRDRPLQPAAPPIDNGHVTRHVWRGERRVVRTEYEVIATHQQPRAAEHALIAGGKELYTPAAEIHPRHAVRV